MNSKTDSDALILLDALKSYFDVRWGRAFECLLARFVLDRAVHSQGRTALSVLAQLQHLPGWAA